MTRTAIFLAIEKERIRQNALYTWDGYADYRRSAVLAAQAGKAIDSTLPSGCHEHHELRRRLIQTAAVAVRWLEELPE